MKRSLCNFAIMDMSKMLYPRLKSFVSKSNTETILQDGQELRSTRLMSYRKS